MPSRWWVPLAGIRPEFVKLEFVHAACSAWFDHSPAEHAARDKPYAISPPAGDGRVVGIEIAVLTDEMEHRFAAQAKPGQAIRLGNQFGTVGRPRRLAHATWQELARHTDECAWELEFVTPTAFRRRDVSSPLPVPATVLRGLSVAWGAWSGLPPRELARQDSDLVWVSDLSLASQRVTVGGLTVSGALGRVRFRCDDPRVASGVGPLFHLAQYAGVGASRGKGLGVTRLVDTQRRRPGRGATAGPGLAHGVAG